MSTEIEPAAQPDADADVRYNAKITGYNRLLRGRVRQVETQVDLLVTKRIRDTTTVAHHLEPTTLTNAYERARLVSRMLTTNWAGVGDLRAEYVSLAATAIILAEEADRPAHLRGPKAPRCT